MKKIKFYVCFSILCMLFGMYSVKANDDGLFPVTDEASFDICLKEENTCRLMSDLVITTNKSINRDLILDLNGHSITPDSSLTLHSGLFVINRGAKLTINDSKGTSKISTGTSGNVWAAIQLLTENKGTELAELIVNGGTIEGYYYGITGNGNNHNTKVTINGGNIKGLNKEDSAGIFQPQKGEIIINGGNITGGTAIEIRSGNLTVNQGTITGIAQEFIKVANKNGTTTNGVGISIAQHTTKNAIKVLIYDGNISGQYALYEWNPHNNSKEDLSQITLHIYGGEFTGLASGVDAIYSQDFTNFISGGKFNTYVSKYLTEDAKVSSSISGEDMAVFHETTNGKSSTLGILLATISIGGVVGAFVYYKKRYA